MNDSAKELNEFFEKNKDALEPLNTRFEDFILAGDFRSVSIMTVYVSKIIELALNISRQVAGSEKPAGNA